MQQRHVLDLACKRGVNVFYTGSGGVGKSFVTQVIMSCLRHAFVKAMVLLPV